MSRSYELEDRFFTYVNVSDDEDGCHRWTGPRDPRGGTGFFCYRGKIFEASRVAAVLAGIDPQGKEVFQTCGNPECVNPSHLYAESLAKDAKVDGRNRRTVRGESHGRAKLTREQVVSMREERASGDYTLAKLGEKYGCSPQHVRAVTAGKHWTHVGGPITEPHGLSDGEVAEIRRQYWWRHKLQKELAEDFGVTPAHVSRLVRGKSRPAAGGPTSPEFPPMPSASVQAEIREKIRDGHSIDSIEEEYFLPAWMLLEVFLNDEIEDNIDEYGHRS